MPDVVDAIHVLALLTRVRAARIAAGEISAARLYDVRAFKCVLAELGYLRTLTRRATGGTIVTSMPQLVKGLARLHPAWRMTGDKFVDRDRHQQSVRRRLRDLDGMGVLRWRIGVDVDGEDARTELELRSAPDITDDELAAAGVALARWQTRYGAALNTGSSTGIRNAAGHARPLSADERQRRGLARARQRAARVRASSTTNSAPRFATPTMSENNTVFSSNVQKTRSACGARTDARARHNDADKTWMTRPQPNKNPNDNTAISATTKTASLTMGGAGPPAGSTAGVAWDEAALVKRVAARLAAHQPVWDMIAVQARERAAETACWGLDRSWPAGRLCEAWVVWRYGSMCAAELGAAPAGGLEADDLQRLRRALGRYERHVACAPCRFPAGGLAVLARIAAIADERDARPQTLHYAIRVLDQLSRRMRAAATADDAGHRERAAARARRRRMRKGSSDAFAFRISAWPSWVALDDNGDPLLEGDELVLVAKAGIQAAPDRDDLRYLQTLRDAQLLAGLWPRPEADGRSTMAADQDYDYEAAHRRARPGPYAPPTDRRARLEFADMRLAQIAAMSLRTVQRLSTETRDKLLKHYRVERAEQRTAERDALCARLAELDISVALEDDGDV
jgi:AraC-like DNA-binding protein